MMRIAKVDAVCKIWPFSSILFLLFAVTVCPALLQSHRNQIQAATPFPRKNEEAARASIP
jgi:hypothetical protein